MEVRKIMTKNPACCTPDSTLEEVAHMMEMYDCGCIPVVGDHKTGQPVGTITDRDIAIRSLAENKNPLEMKASDIMTTDIATVAPETTVEQCRDEMENRQIRRILVVDKSGKCVGIVAQADLVGQESNAQQTAEFMHDVSQPSHSRQGETSFANERNDLSSERESYRNFSNQNRDHERHSSTQHENRNRSFSEQGRKHERAHAKKKSFFGGGYLLPLAIGVGAGAALKYFMPASEKPTMTFVPREKVTNSLHTTTGETTARATNSVPTVEEETTAKARVELLDQTDVNAKISGGVGNEATKTSILETDADETPGIGRTARL